ncbi:MAG: cytochrome c oxidase subunit 4 [Microbacteriaceae bacterium]
MGTNAKIFWIIAGFFFIVSVGYMVWGWLTNHAIEWSGGTPLALVALFTAFVAFYLGRVHAGQTGELPEDRLDGNIDDGDPELGHFSPWSWWPFLISGAAALAFLGIAVGFWITFVGVTFAVVCLVGWTFEYYRGYFAR